MLERSAVSDAEGWVRLRLDDLLSDSGKKAHGSWYYAPQSSPADYFRGGAGATVTYYVEAPGFAPAAFFGSSSLEPSVRLEPGNSVELLGLPRSS